MTAALPLFVCLFAAEAEGAVLAACPRLSGEPEAGPQATGVCVGLKDGYAFVLTAAHAVPKGEARAFEFFARGEAVPGRTVIGGDVLMRQADPDLALVRLVVGRDAVPVLPLAGKGERPRSYPFPARAVGCPDGRPPQLRAVGIDGKKLVRKGERVAFFWEGDDTPVGGMSGGPLLDANGRVVGICTAVRGGRGYYTHLDEILVALKRSGQSWLGEKPAEKK